MELVGLIILGLGALLSVLVLSLWMYVRTEYEWKQPMDLERRSKDRRIK